MAQSALTVTPPSPTPPTNMGFTGATPPSLTSTCQTPAEPLFGKVVDIEVALTKVVVRS